jgi:putative redox protein
MKSSVNVEWQKNMHFISKVNGIEIHLDADKDSGGENLGPRPKPLLMTALGGCTGMDIASILKKMQVEIEYFNVIVEGISEEEHPKKFTSMHIIYEIKAKNLSTEKLEKAINLSLEKYCSVKATLASALKITHEYIIRDI